LAIFNPQVPEVADKNYFGYSKPIEPVTFKSGAGEALKEGGQLVQTAAKEADSFVENQAKTETRDVLEAARDEYSQSLATADKQIRFAANAQPTSGEGGGGEPTNILAPSPGTSLPKDIQQLPQTLGVLTGARASGKLSETDFYARTSTILKDIRAKYPNAYRDVIDQEASRILGTNPANAYIKSVLGDINSFMAGGQSQFNHMFNELSTKGLQFPGGQQALSEFMRTGDINKAAGFLAPNMARKYNLEVQDLQMKNTNMTGDVLKNAYRQNANEHANAAVQETLHAVTYIPGMTDPQKLNQVIMDAQSGKIQLSSEQFNQLANLVQAYKQQTLNNIDKRFSNNVNGNSINGVIGYDETTKIKDNAVKVFDQMEKALRDKDIGLAMDTVRHVQALDADAALSLRKDKDIGAASTRAKAARDLFGNSIYEKLFERDVYNGIQGGFKNWLDRSRVSLSSSDPRQATTMKQLTDDLLFGPAQTNHPDYKFQMPKAFRALQDMISGPEGITSSKMPDATKDIIFKNTFSKDNWGMLAKIAPDTWDEQRRRVPGSQSVFAGFTNPPVVEEAAKIGKRNASARADYLDWVNTTAQNDLLKPDAALLKGINFNVPLNWKIQYDPEGGEFQLIRAGSNLMQRDIAHLDVGVRQYAQSLAHVNSVLRSLNNVGEGMGMVKPKNYALETFLETTGKGEIDEKGNVSGFDVLAIPGLPPEVTKSEKDRRDLFLEGTKRYKEQYKLPGRP